MMNILLFYDETIINKFLLITHFYCIRFFYKQVKKRIKEKQDYYYILHKGINIMVQCNFPFLPNVLHDNAPRC